ncbi:unnamed protein product [Prorocentrum cordatum]|uniref:Phytanoyl-CoA dioxygenase n=1 Tax=Prorocentrum cordatum TaxID=2364126 RepID=A0ABN9UE35_9DINO|nr:unnamed protein product [Polarella glacialis]
MALAGSLRRLASGAVRRPRQCGLMTAAQAEFFERSGYVKVPGALTKSDVGELRRWVDEIASWPEVEDAWVHHFERGRAGSNQLVLSRTENFFPFHAGMARFLSSGVPAQLAGDALREEASLYKEKINYKVPGGGGYTAHQDAPAYAESDCHVTCLVTLDEAGLDNGCLEFSAFPWQRKELIGLTKEGVISDDVAASLDFEAVPTEPGDALVFSSYVPHRSAANTSSKARNLLYLTYNRKSAGDLRSQYYHNRRATMHAGRVSTIGHFQGSVAEDDDLALAPRTRASTPSKAREEIIAKIAKLFEDRGGSRYDSFSTQSRNNR